MIQITPFRLLAAFAFPSNSFDGTTMLRTFPSAVIENLQPLIDGGRYPVERVTGEDLIVEADIFKEGHDVVAAALKWRMAVEPRWHETPMKLIVNDRWRGACTFYENAI